MRSRAEYEVALMKNLPDLLCQTAYSAIDSFLVLGFGLLKYKQTRHIGNLTAY